MRITIGENLKKLRLERDLTQEQLAEVFGLSPQAISRWENNTTYPDITLLPGIAVFYNTTIDELIGMNEIRKTDNITEIHNEVHRLIAINQFDKAVSKLREGLKIYPNNSGLLLALAETLSHNCNSIEMLKESISLLKHILQQNDISIKAKSTATVTLIFLYLKLSKIDHVNQLIHTLPHFWESREILLPEGFEGDDYKEEFRKSIIKLLVFICDKIRFIPTRNPNDTPVYIQLGIDFEPKYSVDEMIEMIRTFLLT